MKIGNRMSAKILALLFCISAPAIASAEHFGFQDDWIFQSHMAGEAHYGGSDSARYPIDWRALEPSDNYYDPNFLNILDTAVNTLYSRGQKTILQLYAAPAWAGGSQTAIQPPSNAHVISYEDATTFLLNRYPGKIRAVEIWNEPNTSYYGNVSISKMDLLIKAGKAAINRSGQTSVKLITGGLYPTTNWQTYLQDLKNVTGADVHLGFHAYDLGSNKANAIAAVKSKYDQAKQIAGTRELWITEYGFGSTQFSGGESAQSDASGQLYDYMKANGAKCIIYYRLTHSTYGGGVWTGFSALRSDGSRKPVFNTLRNKRNNPPPYFFDSNAEGWFSGNAMTSLIWWTDGTWPGIIYGDQTGADAYIYSSGTSLTGLGDTTINISFFPQYGITFSHDMQLFWKTDQENFWDINKASPAVTYNGQNWWVSLNLDVNNTRWNGKTINQLRLDFDNANSQTRWIVDHFLPQTVPKWWFGSSSEGWVVGNGLSPLVWWSDATWPGTIYADQTGPDAFLYSPGFEFFGGANDVLKVRVYPQGGNTANHQMKVYWVSKSDMSWSESKSSAVVNFTAQNTWAEVTLKVGANPNWSWDFVKQLRLDLDGDSVNSGARWIIDYITILPQAAQQY